MVLRVMLNEDQFERLVKGESVSVRDRATEMATVEIALEDIGFDRMAEVISDATTRRMEIKATVADLSRFRIVDLLEGASIACYENETDAQLREALVVNVLDGTISEGALDE